MVQNFALLLFKKVQFFISSLPFGKVGYGPEAVNMEALPITLLDVLIDTRHATDWLQ